MPARVAILEVVKLILVVSPLAVIGCSSSDSFGPPDLPEDATDRDDSDVADTDSRPDLAGSGGLAWDFPIGGWGASPAVGADGTIFLAQSMTKDYGSGSVFALDPDGTVRWEFALPEHGSERICGERPTGGDPSEWEAECTEWIGGGVWSIEASPSGVLYVGQAMYSPSNRDEARHIFALSQADGSEIWRYDLGHRNVLTHIAVDEEENIFFATFSRDGTAFHGVSREGNELWTHVVRDDESYPGSPAISGDTVIFGGDAIRAFRGGELLWEYEAKSSAWLYAPAVDGNGDIYILSPYDFHMHKLDVEGNLLGRVEVGFTETTPIIGSDGTIYIHNYPHELFPREGGPSGGLAAGVHAFNPDLSLLWSAPGVMTSDDPDWEVSSGVTGSDSIMALGPDDTLYFGSEHGSIYALRDGVVLWEQRLFSEFDMRLAFTDGLVVACQSGFIRFESESARCYALEG